MRRVLVLTCLLFTVLAISPPPASAGGFCPMGPFEDEEATTVSMGGGDMCFSPTIARVAEGGDVTFVNDDTETHAVGGIAGTFGDIHKALRPGDRVTYSFDEEGVFPYVCILHPGMGGAVVVGGGKADAQAAAAPPSGAGGSAGAVRERPSSSPVAAIALVAVAATALGYALFRSLSLRAATTE